MPSQDDAPRGLEELSGNVGIYCYENLLNGKKYVGQSKMLKIRIRDHERNFKESIFWFSGENKPLWKSVRKYGRENFSLCILRYCSESELDELEIYYIKELNSHKSKHGYNISWGGNSSVRGLKFSSKTRKKMSDARLGEKNPFYKKTHSEETRKKISDWRRSNKDKWYVKGENHFNFGKHASDEAKKKMSESRIGSLNSRFGTKLKNSASKYFGVTRDRHHNLWVAKYYGNKTKKYLGGFKLEIDAAIAYNDYIVSNNLSNPLNIITGE